MLGNRRKLPAGKNNLRKTNGARSPTICRTRGNLADKSPASAVQSRPGEKSRTGKTGHCKVATTLRTNREPYLGLTRRGVKKTLRAKECRRGLRVSKNLYML